MAVDDAGEAGHGVEGGGCIDQVDVQEGEEGEGEVGAGAAGDVPVLDPEDGLDGMEGDDFLEEVELLVAGWGAWEVGEGGVTAGRC